LGSYVIGEGEILEMPMEGKYNGCKVAATLMWMSKMTVGCFPI